MKPNRINELYSIWESDPSLYNLEDLLTLVRRRIVTRYCEVEPEIHEDIAQRSITFIWRALVSKDVAEFSQDRGSFAGYCAMIARRERSDMIKNERLTAVKDEVLEPLTSDIDSQTKGY